MEHDLQTDYAKTARRVDFVFVDPNPPAPPDKAEDPASNVDSSEAAIVLEFVRERNVFCPACDYNLRNLTRPRCPECGQDLVLRVGVVEPKLGQWLLLSVPMLLTAGVGTLLTYIMVRDGNMPPSGRAAVLIWCYIATVPAAVATVVGRRRFARLPSGLRLFLTLLSCMVVLFIAALTVVSGFR